jgi:hypothetical protein
MATTNKEIKLKDGSTLPKGLRVSFIPDRDSRCLVHSPAHAEPLQVRITSAFKAPSMASLEKWSCDGIAKTPTGKRVEPDSHGPDGSPSWLLALGFI